MDQLHTLAQKPSLTLVAGSRLPLREVRRTEESRTSERDGTVRGRINHFHPQAPDRLGEFRALDLRTGETLWRHGLRVPYNTSALTTGGGLGA